MPNQTFSRPANSSPVPTMPAKPFAMRRDSPVSSAGDSSSGRAPLTPRDGSDIYPSRKPGDKGKDRGEEWGSGVSGLSVPSSKGTATAHAPRHVKRRSVSFEDEIQDQIAVSSAGRKLKEVESDDSEVRRRERRRSEAKAAIEVRSRFCLFFCSDCTEVVGASLEMSSMVLVLSCRTMKTTCLPIKL